MKKPILLMLALATQAMSAFGQQPAPSQNFTPDQKEQIALAIKILAESGVLKADANQCAQFDTDLISELRTNGLLTEKESEVGSICVGAAVPPETEE